MIKKYGFVYIWYDRKHKRYYIGCRWGNINDGYICSSSWMKKAYKIRPQDFKRKILKTNINSKLETIEEENKWLQLIKKEELGKKYYNLTNHLNGHWSTCEKSTLSVGEKISLSHKSDPNWANWSKNRVVSEKTKELARQNNKRQFEDINQREIRRQKTSEQWKDPEFRKTNTENKIGIKQSEETKKKRSTKMIGNKYRKDISPANKNKSASEETKQKLRDAWVLRKEKRKVKYYG